MLGRSGKENVLEGLRRNLDKSAGVLFLDFTGLTVAEANAFRRRLQDDDILYQVVKNTLMHRALSGRPYEAASDCLKGSPTGVVFGMGDPVQSAKTVFDFMKNCDHLRVKGGVVEDRALSPADAEGLSKMPSRAELQASVVALAMSPGRNLASQLQSAGSRVVGAVDALVTKLEETTPG